MLIASANACRLFQFALPRGERLYSRPRDRGNTWFQFALPRGERRRAPNDTLCNGDVSIRAPAWGATGAGWRCSRGWVVSIRAPAWGATAHTAALMKALRVSIRAPAWGATAITG